MAYLNYLHHCLRSSIVCMAIVAAATPLAAEEIKSAPASFDAHVDSWAALPATLARIVYYRDVHTLSSQRAANVYLNGRFHTILQAGSFSVFCLTPGTHLLSSYLREAPFYPGKNASVEPVQITGGHTYYLKVDEELIAGGNTGVPVPVDVAAARLALAHAHEQVQVLSRAATVACPQSK